MILYHFIAYKKAIIGLEQGARNMETDEAILKDEGRGRSLSKLSIEEKRQSRKTVDSKNNNHSNQQNQLIQQQQQISGDIEMTEGIGKPQRKSTLLSSRNDTRNLKTASASPPKIIEKDNVSNDELSDDNGSDFDDIDPGYKPKIKAKPVVAAHLGPVRVPQKMAPIKDTGDRIVAVLGTVQPIPIVQGKINQAASATAPPPTAAASYSLPSVDLRRKPQVKGILPPSGPPS
jgi:hypothetical protein